MNTLFSASTFNFGIFADSIVEIREETCVIILNSRRGNIKTQYILKESPIIRRNSDFLPVTIFVTAFQHCQVNQLFCWLLVS